jgi:hypothetical protein
MLSVKPTLQHVMALGNISVPSVFLHAVSQELHLSFGLANKATLQFAAAFLQLLME